VILLVFSLLNALQFAVMYDDFKNFSSKGKLLQSGVIALLAIINLSEYFKVSHRHINGNFALS